MPGRAQLGLPLADVSLNASRKIAGHQKNRVARFFEEPMRVDRSPGQEQRVRRDEAGNQSVVAGMESIQDAAISLQQHFLRAPIGFSASMSHKQIGCTDVTPTEAASSQTEIVLFT